ncbi:MAG: polyribonucleotide nucleotidyltransferase [Patescibacteria group bacterium]|nr:polyribonucleotide nucleotidyltransferase [Patescibacteria group bacterium]
MKAEEHVFSTEWLGRTLTIKTGKLAKQANAAVTAQYGDTVVLATVVESKNEREGIDFFPLMVDYEERLYAAGLIKGSRWVKREGRPTDESVLIGRMIDRSIRPLFSGDSRRDVQVIITVLSVDHVNRPDIVALIAASAVLSISGLNWQGPISGVRVGRIDGRLIFNPNYEEQENCDLDLIVAGTEKKVIMIEAGAKEVKEGDMHKAIMAGQKELQAANSLINKMKAKVETKQAKTKVALKSEDEIKDEEEKEKLFEIANDWLKQNVNQILFDKIYYTKGERKAAVTAIKEGLDKYLFERGIGKDNRGLAISRLVEPAVEAEVTREIIDNERRVDSRKLDEIRFLSSEAGIFPRNHGSGLFSRGETQIMSIVTLAEPGMEQYLEGLEGQTKKRYIHHYNFPPYSVGEARPIRSAGRRDIGHGALAEKALIPVIPAKEGFPYTIRVVSETLSSNGSSSMGSTCASTLALMDAGVPIKKPVAGIAMGLASNKDMSKWKILADIQDLEDGEGGMDFKITGTKDGITAIQLDTKTSGLTEAIIKETLDRGLDARLEILKVIHGAIAEPRTDLSPYAPRIITFLIPVDKIREVIGSGGKVINEIIDACGVTIDIEDDGTVFISGVDQDGAQKAEKWIKDLTREFRAGEIFAGKVVRHMDFGAFVELVSGRDGMVHVSKLAPYRVGKPSDLIDIGQTVQVKIEEIDEQGRVNLTMLGLPENEALWKDQKGKSNGFGAPRFNRDNNRGRFNNGPRGRRPSGGGGFRRDR